MLFYAFIFKKIYNSDKSNLDYYVLNFQQLLFCDFTYTKREIFK